MNWVISKMLQIPEVIDGPGNQPILTIKKVPVYAIPFTKQGFCKATVTIETKEGPKVIQRCGHAGKEHSCTECIKLAKKLYKMNGIKN
jgi:hypothetical protein